MCNDNALDKLVGEIERRERAKRRNAYIALVGYAIIFVLFVAMIIPVALSREEKRLDAVQEHNCKNYGPAMNEWARSKGIKEPCDGKT